MGSYGLTMAKEVALHWYPETLESLHQSGYQTVESDASNSRKLDGKSCCPNGNFDMRMSALRQKFLRNSSPIRNRKEKKS